MSIKGDVDTMKLVVDNTPDGQPCSFCKRAKKNVQGELFVESKMIDGVLICGDCVAHGKELMS